MSQKKPTNYIIQVGKTIDNKIVVDGVWKTFETHGIPLDILFMVFIEKNVVPDWKRLYNQMFTSGMEHSRIISKLEEAIIDSFGKEFCDVVIFTLEQIFKPQEK